MGCTAGWWFQIFFMFTLILGKISNLIMFLKWVGEKPPIKSLGMLTDVTRFRHESACTRGTARTFNEIFVSMVSPRCSGHSVLQVRWLGRNAF